LKPRLWTRWVAAVGFVALLAPGVFAEGHEAAAHEGAAHEGGHEHHQAFNWATGMIGERAGVEPGFLWRAPGTPAPFAAQLFNAILFFGLVIRFAREPVARGLQERRDRIQRGIEEATQMREEAERSLAAYRQKLDTLGAEIERVRREMREGAEADRRRVLEDAAARRVRLEQEAKQLIERELEAARDQLTRETAQAALQSARELLRQNVSTDDHRRFCEDYLQRLSAQPQSSNGAGPRSERA
jgi:F-type H+-transporting ATPase subunit b